MYPDLSKIDRNDKINMFIEEFHVDMYEYNYKLNIKGEKEFICGYRTKSSIFIKCEDIDSNRAIMINMYEQSISNGYSGSLKEIIHQIKCHVHSEFRFRYKGYIEDYLNENPMNTMESYIGSKSFYRDLWYNINDVLMQYLDGYGFYEKSFCHFSEITINKEDILGYVTCSGEDIKIYDKNDDEVEYIDNFYYQLYVVQHKWKGLILPTIVI